MNITVWNSFQRKRKYSNQCQELARFDMMQAIKMYPNQAKRLVLNQYRNTSKIAMPQCKKRLRFDGCRFLRFEYSKDSNERTGLPNTVKLMDNTSNIIFQCEAANHLSGTTASSVLCYPNNTAVEFNPEMVKWPTPDRLGLSRDCLYTVFTLLCPTQLLACRLVSVNWRDAASSDTLWRDHVVGLAPVQLNIPLYQHYVRATFKGVLQENHGSRLSSYLASPKGAWLFTHIMRVNTNTTTTTPTIMYGERHTQGIINGKRHVIRHRYSNMFIDHIPFKIISWIKCYLHNIKPANY